jgi:uncharacterized protein
MVEIKEQFDVPAPARTVWNLLSDPQAVVGCVPGAVLGEQHEDGTFDGSLTVKFGPAKVTFRARIELELDQAAMAGRVISKGKDSQGGTRFNATMAFSVSEQTAEVSTVTSSGQVEIYGKLAGLVESGAKIVVKRMAAEFAERLAATCAGANAK